MLCLCPKELQFFHFTVVNLLNVPGAEDGGESFQKAREAKENEKATVKHVNSHNCCAISAVESEQCKVQVFG